MKILHTSDWHLGQHFYGKSRANEHQQFLSWLLTQAVEQAIDVIVVAGDIFDTGTPPSYARELYFDFIGKLQQTQCQLVVLAGNHDSVAMLSESKQVLSQLNTHVIAVANDDIAQQVLLLKSKVTDEEIVLCAIPFIRPRDVIKSQAGQSAQEKQSALQQGISEHYQHMYEYAGSLGKPNTPIVMTGHLTTVGASTSDSVREIYIGTLDAFPASAFPPANYIALGHIHQHQRIAKSDHIRYSGSPIPLSFDEANQQKVVLIAEFNQQSLIDVQEIKIPTFQSMKMLKTTIDQLNADVEQLAASQGDKTLWLDVEITSTDYLHDISQRIQELTANTSIEVLLVRRAKQSRQKLSNAQDNITLNELTVNDVFEARLAQEEWQEDEQIERKKRLTSLYQTFVEKAEHDEADV